MVNVFWTLSTTCREPCLCTRTSCFIDNTCKLLRCLSMDWQIGALIRLVHTVLPLCAVRPTSH